MEVTNIKFEKCSPRKHGFCAEATIVLDDSLVIHKILVSNGDGGLYITYPNCGNKMSSEGKVRFEDLVHPSKKSLSDYIKSEVLSAYKQYICNLQSNLVSHT